MEANQGTCRPFESARVQIAALRLKFSSLPWTPAEGDVVWDPAGALKELTNDRTRVFRLGCIEEAAEALGDDGLRQNLVWMPTRRQVEGLAQRWHLQLEEADVAADELLAGLYDQLAACLENRPLATRRSPARDSGPRPQERGESPND